MIEGVGENVPVETTETGGKQSAIPFRFDLIDANALLKLAGVMHHGAIKYKENNWRLIKTKQHLNHAMMHITAYLAGDTQSDHLSHAFTRLMMAIGTEGDHV